MVYAVYVPTLLLQSKIVLGDLFGVEKCCHGICYCTCSSQLYIYIHHYFIFL